MQGDSTGATLGGIDPQAHLATTLTRPVNRHAASQIDDIMRRAYANPVA